jgi:hypothetical protein
MSYIYDDLVLFYFVYSMNNIAMSKNIMTKGNKTKNQDKLGTPAWQIKLRIHVHNNTYASLIRKSKNVLFTSQLYSPKQ